MIRSLMLSTVLISLIAGSCTKQNEAPPVLETDSLGTGWKKVDLGTNIVAYDIWFSGNVGFTVGGYQVLKSDDFGETWTNKLHTQSQVFNVSMGSPQNVMAIGIPQTIYYSNNAGASFDSVKLKDKQLSEIFCVSPTVAYAIGYNFWKTVDAGKTWQKVYSFPDFNERLYRTIHFLNEQQGWATAPRSSSDVGIYKTQNGGVSWQFQDSGLAKFSSNSLYFTDDATGYSGNGKQIIKTADGGATWMVVHGGEGGFGDTHFFSSESGYVSAPKKIYKTIDGGLNFTTEVSLSNTNDLARVIEIYFSDPHQGWACGYTGAILKYQKP